MINNYEFTDGSWDLSKTIIETEYKVGVSVKDRETIYVSCNNISKGYIFGKIIKEEEEE